MQPSLLTIENPSVSSSRDSDQDFWYELALIQSGESDEKAVVSPTGCSGCSGCGP